MILSFIFNTPQRLCGGGDGGGTGEGRGGDKKSRGNARGVVHVWSTCGQRKKVFTAKECCRYTTQKSMKETVLVTLFAP